jgi:hypothetical protein
VVDLQSQVESYLVDHPAVRNENMFVARPSPDALLVVAALTSMQRVQRASDGYASVSSRYDL